MQDVYVKNGQLYRPLPLHICSFGKFNNLADIVWMNADPTFGAPAWPANNRAIYSPIQMPAPFTIARFMVYNGANLTGTADVGLYDNAGNRLLSTGATARAGASVVQYIGVTDRRFPAGHYYLALLGTSTTGTYVGASGTIAALAQAAGMLQEDVGAAALPATMTPAAYSSTALFCFGFTQSDAL